MTDIFGKMADDSIRGDLAALTRRVESLEANVRDHEQTIGAMTQWGHCWCKRCRVQRASEGAAEQPWTEDPETPPAIGMDALWDAARAVGEAAGSHAIRLREMDVELYQTISRLRVVVERVDRP